MVLIKRLYILYIIFIKILLSSSYNEQFRVCGSYCGPGWCNNMWLDESKCNTSIKPEHHLLTGYSCADLCCQKHDKCCGQDKSLQQDCNKEIVKCLSKCDPLSLTCSYDYIPVPAGIIEGTMDILESWCCGEPCKYNLQDKISVI